MKRTKQQQRPRRKRKAAKQLNGGLAKKAKMEKNGYSSSSSLAAAPVAKTTVMKNEGPEFKYKSNGDIRVIHREYVSEVKSGTGNPSGYQVQSFPVNPGLVSSFPWLAGIAKNYESYIFNRLAVYYKSEASSSLGGSAFLTIDYDAVDAAPATKAIALSYRSAVRSSPWNNCELICETKDLHKNKSNFVRAGSQPSGTDLKTYDIANLYFGSESVAGSGVTLGEIWVEYDVSLFTPSHAPTEQLVINGGYITYSDGGLTPLNPFGTSAAVDIQASGFHYDSKLMQVYFDAPGWYMFVAVVGGTGMTGSNCSVNPNITTIHTFIQTTTTSMKDMWVFEVLAPAAIDWFVIGSTVTSCYANIGSIPPFSNGP